jgi:hypothetical protein
MHEALPGTVCRDRPTKRRALTQPFSQSEREQIRIATPPASYGKSLFGSGWLASRGPTVPRRAFSDCGWPLRIAA